MICSVWLARPDDFRELFFPQLDLLSFATFILLLFALLSLPWHLFPFQSSLFCFHMPFHLFAVSSTCLPNPLVSLPLFAI